MPESWISPERIVSLGQIGLLERHGSTEILTVRECALAERHAKALQIVIPATCPPRNSPFGKGSRNRCDSPVPIRHCNLRWIRSRRTWGPKSLARPLAACHSPAGAQITPKALFHLVFSRSTRPARPWASCRLAIH